MLGKLNQHNMYQAVCSKDMYKQCLPSNFIHLIFSTFGFHWLSKSMEEHKNMLIKTYHRSEDEMRLPFCQGSKVSALGLELQSFTRRNWTAAKHPGNKNNQENIMWASCLTSVARVWSHTPMIESLQDHRTQEDKMNLMNRFYDNLKTRLLECKFDLDYTIADLIISKT
ncbi:uncharacterized protein LOC127706692 [Mytilus californianus]|uniref:uncharacterized protein LOC127706692 n=1 Tax=Mytilus californianus TaxID=6549 RepID=UPI002246CA42|nr:uncharacterized protein LOC127706692 [Mytilus californianus]